MELRVGMRLRSINDTTKIIVLRAPSEDVDITCGGGPMAEEKTSTIAVTAKEVPSPSSGGTELGKRYALDGTGVEVLVTRGGAGILAIGGTPLEIKAPKKLPSSD